MFSPHSSVRLLLELPLHGGAAVSHHVSATYVYRYISALDNVVLACELLFVAATLLKVRHELMQVLRLKGQYVHNLWNTVQVGDCQVEWWFGKSL